MANVTVWITYHSDDLLNNYGLNDIEKDGVHKLFPSHKYVTEPNINYANSFLSEMVTMWYVWKNGVMSDLVGFEHYRRHLSLGGRMPGDGEAVVYEVLDFRSSTVYGQFVRCHGEAMIRASVDVLDEVFGVGNRYSMYIIEDTRLISRCCFVMRWPDFCKMCEWLFPLLEKMSAKILGVIDPQYPFGSVEQWEANMVMVQGRRQHARRILSCIAERLISAYIMVNMKWRLSSRDGGFVDCRRMYAPSVGREGLTFATVNYNTPDLVEAAIMSIMKHVPDIRKIVVLDNSDREQVFCAGQEMEGVDVEVLDNSKGEVVDIERWLEGFPHRMRNEVSNLGTAKHTRSIQWIMDYLRVPFFLFDSDILLKMDVTCLANRDCAWAGGVRAKRRWIARALPFLCYINTPMLEENGIKYLNPDFLYGIHKTSEAARYDTGAWLYRACNDKGLPHLEVPIDKWIEHMRNGSWKAKNRRAWLDARKDLWYLGGAKDPESVKTAFSERF